VSRFKKLSHTIWHCQNHLTWVPKYRFRILTGSVKESVEEGVHAICGYTGCEITEMNIQGDHVYMVQWHLEALAAPVRLGGLIRLEARSGSKK
jgi:putative transposase